MSLYAVVFDGLSRIEDTRRIQEVGRARGDGKLRLDFRQPGAWGRRVRGMTGQMKWR